MTWTKEQRDTAKAEKMGLVAISIRAAPHQRLGIERGSGVLGLAGGHHPSKLARRVRLPQDALGRKARG